MGIARIVVVEFFLSFFLGAVPALIVGFSVGQDALLKFISDALPKKWLTLYIVLLLMVQVILYLMLLAQKSSNKIYDGQNNLLEFYRQWSQLGFTLQGVFRSIYGSTWVVLGFAFFTLDYDSFSFLLPKAALVVFVLMVLTACFSGAQKKLNR